VISDFDNVTSRYFPIVLGIKSDSYKLFINLTLLDGLLTGKKNFDFTPRDSVMLRPCHQETSLVCLEHSEDLLINVDIFPSEGMFAELADEI
jgi:hypothetical protein